MSEQRTPGAPTTVDGGTPLQRDRATTIFERSVEGRRAATLPDCEVPETPLAELIPAKLLRERPAELPEVSEPEIVRHYNRISRRNFDLDTGFYPLGSCTMKHNPRINEKVAALPGHARLHPAQEPGAPRARSSSCGASPRPSPRSRGCRTSASSPRRAPRASWRGCCSPAPTTPTAARSARGCSPPTRRTAPIPPR